MTTSAIPGHRTDPSISINDRRFEYVPAAKTDIRVTFEREIARLKEARAQTPETTNQQQKVRELRRAK